MEGVKDLNKGDFKKFVSKGKCVVDFWAEWCGPCRIMGPIFKETASELKGKAHFGKVNVDENHELAQEFGVMSIPTTIFFKDGEPVDRITGVIEKEELVEKIREIE